MNQGVSREFARGRDQHGLRSEREIKRGRNLAYGLPARDHVQVVTKGKGPAGWRSRLNHTSHLFH